MKRYLILIITFLLSFTVNAQIPNYVPSNGLISWFPFNGNANDNSGNGFNGSVSGATLTTDRFGNSNSAYNFAENQQITIPNSADQNHYPLTVSLWYNPSTQPTGTSTNIFSKYVAASWNGFQIVYADNTNVTNDGVVINNGFGTSSWYARDLNNRVIGYYGSPGFLQANVATNTWYHYVFVLDATGGKIYVNGILVSSDTWDGTPGLAINNFLWKIGGQYEGNSWFNGKIDDIGIWNRALNQTEISGLYNGVNYSNTCNNVSGSLTQGLVGYWPFCGNANDDSGNGNNGTVSGAVLTTDRFNNTNNAYIFQNNSDIINKENFPINSQNFTISAWVKINTAYSYSTFNILKIGPNDNTTNGGISIKFDQNDSFYGSGLYKVYGSINSSNTGSTIHSNSLNYDFVSNWHHYVLRKNNALIELFIDSQLVSSTNILSNIDYTNNWLRIGDRANINNNQIGIRSLDDIGIWNRALTVDEVTQLYNQNQCINYITVTDTLIINVGQLSFESPILYANNITIFPNPASTQININFNNITNLAGGSIKIINSIGQQVSTTPITTSGTNSTMSLSTWGGSGLYFVQILNSQGQIVDIKKIVLQ